MNGELGFLSVYFCIIMTILYGTTKTHKFNNINDININDLKFKPIVDQTNTHTYHAIIVISHYLKPSRSNEYLIKDTKR